MPYPLESLPYFALLDNNYDSDAPSYLFEMPIEFITVSDIEEANDALTRIEKAQQEGLYAAGFISYEFARHYGYYTKASAGEDLPLLEFGLFRQKTQLTNDEVEAFLATHFSHQLAFTSPPQANISKQQYDEAIERVKHELEEGNSYQVNYTYETRMQTGGCPVRLYQRLREAQAVPFGAFLHFPSQTVLSRSPELFFEKTGEDITTRPMKGTEKRDLTDSKRDEELKHELRESPKQRAENLMIVDLLRNDLGRIAQIGSVRVTKLFSVETYKTVHQMTSTITAKVDQNTNLSTILEALFPCGSITGAPKLRTTKIIDELEPASRGVYCGAIGYIDNNNMTFNVPIRTLMVDSQRHARFHIGGGIVYDSLDTKEYEETLLKGRFLFDLAKEFNVLESMLFSVKDGTRLEKAHLERLAHSAEFFGYPFEKDKLERALREFYKTLSETSKVRIELKPNGSFSLDAAPLQEFDGQKVVYLSSKRIDAFDPSFHYKTTNRTLFTEELKHFQQQYDAYDVLFANQRDELTEASYHNIMLKFDDEYHTPSLDCGLLNGIGRAQFIKEHHGKVIERRISLDELAKADEILLVNSVRGVVSVRFKDA